MSNHKYCVWCGLPGTLADMHTCHKCPRQYEAYFSYCPDCGSESQHPSHKQASRQVEQVATEPKSPPPASPKQVAAKPPTKAPAPKKTTTAKKYYRDPALPAYQDCVNSSVRVSMDVRERLSAIALEKGMAQSTLLLMPVRDVIKAGVPLPQPTLDIGDDPTNFNFNIEGGDFKKFRARCEEQGQAVAPTLRTMAYQLIEQHNLETTLKANGIAKQPSEAA